MTPEKLESIIKEAQRIEDDWLEWLDWPDKNKPRPEWDGPPGEFWKHVEICGEDIAIRAPLVDRWWHVSHRKKAIGIDSKVLGAALVALIMGVETMASHPTRKSFDNKV